MNATQCQRKHKSAWEGLNALPFVSSVFRSACITMITMFLQICQRTRLQSTTIALISICPDLGWRRGNLTQIAYFSITVTASRYRSTLEIFLWHKDLLCTDLHSILIIFHQLTFGGILYNQTVHEIDIILQFMVMFESETSWVSENIALQSCQNLQTFVWWGAGGGGGGKFVPPTIQMSVKCRDFEELYLRKFFTNHSQTWQFY